MHMVIPMDSISLTVKQNPLNTINLFSAVNLRYYFFIVLVNE